MIAALRNSTHQTLCIAILYLYPYRRERDTTPLIAAVKGENRKVFQLILSQVFSTWYLKKKSYTNIFVQSGIDVNATDFNKYTPLAWAAAWADKKDTIFLTAMAEHPDIQLNKQDDEGYTALGRAAELGRWEAVVYLTSLKGIDVNLCASDDMTPLLCAAGSGHRRVVNRSAIKLFSLSYSLTDNALVIHPN